MNPLTIILTATLIIMLAVAAIIIYHLKVSKDLKEQEFWSGTDDDGGDS